MDVGENVALLDISLTLLPKTAVVLLLLAVPVGVVCRTADAARY